MSQFQFEEFAHLQFLYKLKHNYLWWRFTLSLSQNTNTQWQSEMYLFRQNLHAKWPSIGDNSLYKWTYTYAPKHTCPRMQIRENYVPLKKNPTKQNNDRTQQIENCWEDGETSLCSEVKKQWLKKKIGKKHFKQRLFLICWHHGENMDQDMDRFGLFHLCFAASSPFDSLNGG